MRKFVSAALVPTGDGFITPATGSEPPVPRRFSWNGHLVEIAAVLRSWRSTKTDRGDAYLKRYWFELETSDGQRIEVYYDRDARNAAALWRLYTITDSEN
jgi:hypothetical protein